MKKLIILLLLLLSDGIISEKRQEFNKTIKGYDSYVYLTDEEFKTDDYELIAVVGETSGDLRYSFAFTSDTPGEYQINMQYQDETNPFPAPENKRGDVMIFGIDLKEDISITILHETMELKTLDVKKLTLDEYRLLSPKITGNGSGIPKDRIRSAKPKTAIFILSFIFAAIILVAVIILSLMYALKKGIFSKIKTDTEENEFIFPNPKENREIFVKSRVTDINEEKKEESKEEEKKEVKKEEPPAPKVEVYKKLHDEEDEYDISQKLIAKGLSVDYQNMGMDEKNKVMLELMRMRDLHEITAEEYQSEVIKLWM